MDNTDYWTDGDVPWVSSTEVNRLSIDQPTRYISESARHDCGLRLIPSGSILLGLVGQGRTRGMAALLNIEACINQNTAAIQPSSCLDSRFLLLSLMHLYEPIRHMGRGGQQDALNCNIVGNIEIAIPPISEQRMVANYAIRDYEATCQLQLGLENTIATLLEYRSALISATVTGQIDVRGRSEAEADDALARAEEEVRTPTAEVD